MSKRTTVAAAAAALALPAAATAAVPSKTVHRYKKDYHAVAHKFGKRAPGRNIVKWGLAGGKRASAPDVRRSIDVLERMLHPAPVLHIKYTPAPAPTPAPAAIAAPAPAAPSTSSTSSTTSSTVSSAPAPARSSGSGGYAIPSYIVQCESGGNWRAVNPSSGAGGAYQIMPSTWQAYGGSGLPQNASPAQQSAIASKIWHSTGPSAWQCAH